MMKECLQFLIEPAKKLKIRLKVLYSHDRTPYSRSVKHSWETSVFLSPQESRKRVKLEKKEPLVESQLFIMELARELNKICQVVPPSRQQPDHPVTH